jgi:hypothetical protein
VLIYNNTCFNNGTQPNSWGTPGSGNLAYYSSRVGININPRDRNVKVKNNIIFSNFQYNLSIQGFGNPYTPSGLEIDYNLYYNAGSANIRFSDSSGKEYNYNLLKFRANTPYGVHDIEADPNCVDTASGNFRLNGNSPALNAGFDLSEIFYRDRDGDGNSLPKGSAWDMGAYKYIDVKPPSTLSAPSGLKILPP